MWDLLAQMGVATGQGAGPSAAIVAAHPDDETIGASAALVNLPHCTVIHVTDGAPPDLAYAQAAGFASREDYARARQAEAIAVLGLASVPPSQTLRLNFGDQESSFQLVSIVARLVEIFQRIQPDVVFTHSYEGGHPDHDAAAFAVHAATHLLGSIDAKVPQVIEYTSYFERSGEMVMFDFIPAERYEPVTLVLSHAQRELKRRMRDCYVSQRNVLSGFPIEKELYRLAPRYRFTEPPLPGRLHYERYQWGVTGAEWRRLAGSALETLGIVEPV